MSEPVTIDNFKPLAKLVAGYELQPGKTYLILCDAKGFSPELAHSLLAHLREDHPEISVHIVASAKSKGITVAETEEGDSCETTEPSSSSS